LTRIPNTTPCKSCEIPIARPEYLKAAREHDPSVRLSRGRLLCEPCWKIASAENRLDDYPRYQRITHSARALRVIVDEYNFFSQQGFNHLYIARHFKYDPETLNDLLRRARRLGIVIEAKESR
jgi:hypothetical protein